MFLVLKFTVFWKSSAVFTPWKLSLLIIQILVAKEALLRSLKIKLSRNAHHLLFTPSELFSNTLMTAQLSNCFHWSTGKTLWNWPLWSAPGWIHSAHQWSPRSRTRWMISVVSRGYFWSMSLVFHKDKVNPRFTAWKIGPLNLARWLTLAIRLMCLWTMQRCLPTWTTR